MAVASRFFGKVPGKVPGMVASLSAEKPGFLDIGNSQDTCFPALAAGIINNVLTRPRTNQPIAATLLSRFTDYFTLPQVTGQMLTQSQRFAKMLVRPQVLAQFIQDLSYTLGQIAADELCKNIEKYDGFFNAKEGQQSLALMREAGIPMSESAIKYGIAALANALKIPVIVYVTEPGKELPLQDRWGPDQERAKFDSIVLQAHRNRYLVQVTEVDRFRAASHQATHRSVPVKNHAGVGVDDMPGIVQRIKTENGRLLETFAQNVHRLTAMVAAGELGKQDLLALYIKEMDIMDEKYSLYRAKKAGIAYGSQKFFDDLFDKSNPDHHGWGIVVNENHDQRVIKELVYAFARDISLGRLDENVIFSHLEQMQQRLNLPSSRQK